MSLMSWSYSPCFIIIGLKMWIFIISFIFCQSTFFATVSIQQYFRISNKKTGNFTVCNTYVLYGAHSGAKCYVRRGREGDSWLDYVSLYHKVEVELIEAPEWETLKSNFYRFFSDFIINCCQAMWISLGFQHFYLTFGHENRISEKQDA